MRAIWCFIDLRQQILTRAAPKSILLLICPYLRYYIEMVMVQAHWYMDTLLLSSHWYFTTILCSTISTIVMLYFTIVTSNTMVVPE